MKKKVLLLLSFSFLVLGSASCSTPENPGNDDPSINEPAVKPVGALQEFFYSLRENNFTISYTDYYVNQGLSRSQMSYYTPYSLQSEGDLGFNGYAKNDDCVFSYNLEDGEIVSGLPVVDYNSGVMIYDIYDYRDGMDEFDYTALPEDYEAGSTFNYVFGENAKNDELLLSVFLRKNYNPDVLPKSLTLSLVQDTLRIESVNLDYGDAGQDTINAVIYDVGKTENTEIKNFLETGKTSKTPLNRDFYRLIAPYLESNNYKVRLDATGYRDNSGAYSTFVEDDYYLENAVIYDTISSKTVTGHLQTPGTVATFKLDSIDDTELEITGTPSNQGDGFYSYLYGEYLSYVFSSMGFSNFIGYRDETKENSYYITDSQAQSMLAYMVKFELDSIERSLRSLRLEVDNFEKHEFTLYFEVYNPTTYQDLGVYKASFSNVNEISFPAVDRYLNIGESAEGQDKSELESVLNKFKEHNYSMDVYSDAGLAKVYYTPNYYFIQTYGNPNSNEGYIKLGEAIYEFNLVYNDLGVITSINVNKDKDYSQSMKLPGCGSYNGADDDLFYFSTFDDVIYDYTKYSPTSFMGYSYWKNTGNLVSDPSKLFSAGVLSYFYWNNSTGALPQGAGFMVSDGGEEPYDTRLSLFLAYSSADGLQFGGQYTTFYDIGGTSFDYLDDYVAENN